MMSSSMTIDDEESAYSSLMLMRRLQDAGSRSRAVLTVLYLCLMALCFVIPVFYYIRMHFEERNARRMRELEIPGIPEILEHSENNREESRAARRKYREERRALILQLFGPVRMKLREENFPHLREPKVLLVADSKTTAAATQMIEPSLETSEHEPDMEEGGGGVNNREAEEEKCENVSDQDSRDNDKPAASMESPPSERRDHKALEEESTVVLVPRPGLYVTSNAIQDSSKLREVENMCSICLSNYEVGSDVVWSSNVACEHVFHTKCIEAWLMKQREGPLCPCCRRDFLIDPYDLEEEADEVLGISLADYEQEFTSPGSVTTGTSPVSVAAFQVGARDTNSHEEEMAGMTTGNYGV